MNFKNKIEMYLNNDSTLYTVMDKLANLSDPTPEQYQNLAELALIKVAKNNGTDYNADDLDTAIKIVKDQVLWRACWKDGDIADKYFD